MNSGELIQIITVSSMCAGALAVVVGATVRLLLVGPRLKAQRLAAEAAAAAAASGETARLDARMDALEDEVRQLGQTMQRVAEAVEFDAQLRAPQAPSLPPRLD